MGHRRRFQTIVTATFVLGDGVWRLQANPIAPAILPLAEQSSPPQSQSNAIEIQIVRRNYCRSDTRNRKDSRSWKTALQ